MRNQIAAGYERRDEEEDENEEYHKKYNYIRDRPKYSYPTVEDILHGPCRIHYAYLDGKRVSNHLMRDCRTFLKLQEVMELSQG
jgi:ABC-type iron transport system FetAB ATPase subunit